MAGMDPQSRAYREASKEDCWDGNIVDLLVEGGAYHEALTDVNDLTPPEDYESGEGWDAGREGPKGPAEAREALAARIADPRAPDSEDEMGAYDDMGED